MSLYCVVPSEQDITHFGVKGMKWGVRRYQNEDGTLTEVGKQRLGYSQSDSPADSPEIRSKVHSQAAADDRNLSNALNTGSGIGNRASGALNRSAANKRADKMRKMDISKMSDDELRAAINRLDLEKKYKMVLTEDVGTGRKRVGEILQTVGDIVAIGASAAAIAATIHEIRK